MLPQRPSIIMSYVIRRRRGNGSRVVPILDMRLARAVTDLATIHEIGEPPVAQTDSPLDIIRAIAEQTAHAQDLLNAVLHNSLETVEDVQHETISQGALDAIAPTHRFSKGLGISQEQCAICLTEFRRNKRVKQLPCGHAFCSSCVSQWACDTRACCPICRTDLCPGSPS